jgi:hypothetical protein
LIW